MSIYHCLKEDKRTIPVRLVLMHEATTEKEAITWLEKNGGGIYRNILHKFDCNIISKTNNENGVATVSCLS